MQMDVAQPSGQQGQAEAVSMTEHVQDGQEQVVDPTAQYVLGPDGAYYHHQQLHVGAHVVDDQHQPGDISNLDTGGTWHQQRASPSTLRCSLLRAKDPERFAALSCCKCECWCTPERLRTRAQRA